MGTQSSDADLKQLPLFLMCVAVVSLVLFGLDKGRDVFLYETTLLTILSAIVLCSVTYLLIKLYFILKNETVR